MVLKQQSGHLLSSTACPKRGIWPGPRGDHYLNEYTDGNCGSYIGANTFSSLTLTPGSWFMEDDVTVKSGGTVTVDGGATLTNTFHYKKGGPISAYLNVDGTLDFEAGSTFSAQCDTCGINVSSLSTMKGNLAVHGTPSSPVTLTGPASWDGILLQDNSTASITGMRFSGAGAAGPCRCGVRHAGITVSGAKSVSIVKSSIDGVLGNGIEVSAGTDITAQGLTLTHNAGYALQYDFLSPTLSHLSGLTLRGNGRNAVHSISGTAGSYTTNVFWPNLGYPLIFDVWVAVRPGAALTVALGAVVEFGQGEQFFIKGALHMNGTKAAPITVTSAAPSPLPGSWPGIEFDAGATGSLRYVHEAYAGGTLQCGCGARHAGIVVDGASPAMSHVRVDHSGGNDVEVSHGGVPVLENESFGPVTAGKFGVLVDGWIPGNPQIDATHSWWADKSGPRAAGNPQGKGTPVSAGARYAPWLTAPPI